MKSYGISYLSDVIEMKGKYYELKTHEHEMHFLVYMEASLNYETFCELLLVEIERRKRTIMNFVVF